MKKTLFFVFLVTVFFMSSCSSNLTVDIVPDYETYLKGENVLSALDRTFNFSRGRFMDKRKDPSIIGYYTTGGAGNILHSSQPAEEILFDGLKNLFVRSGHQWTDPPDADILVDIILQDMLSMQTGLIEGGEYATARINVQISFVDSATERVFYTNKYSGSAQKSTLFGPGLNDITDKLQIAIISCMDNVGDDLKLARAIIDQFKTEE